MSYQASGEYICLPGDDLTEMIYGSGANTAASSRKKVILGPGLKKFGDQIQAIKCGRLNHQAPNIYWVESKQKRYIPVRGERVVGVVTNKGGFNVRVDIDGPEPANLSLLAFESATKKNRPNVNIGDVVAARVLTASKDMEAELVCCASNGKRDGLGVLTTPPSVTASETLSATVSSAASNGLLFSINLDTARKLLAPNCPLLPVIGKKFRYEVAVGLNGKVWLRGTSIQNCLLIMSLLMECDHLNCEQIKQLSDSLDNEFEVVKRRVDKKKKNKETPTI